MTPVDYADWLTPERLEAEEAQWETGKLYVRYGAAVRRILLSQYITTVVEFGCGTGWVPTQLDDLAVERSGFSYALIDRNPNCLARARARNLNRRWVEYSQLDIYDIKPQAGLVCGFAVLKHLRLQGWRDVFVQLFKEAQFGLFTMPIADLCMDDGLEFPHVRLTKQYLYGCINAAGHRVLWRDRTDSEEPLYAIGRMP